MMIAMLLTGCMVMDVTSFWYDGEATLTVYDEEDEVVFERTQRSSSDTVLEPTFRDSCDTAFTWASSGGRLYLCMLDVAFDTVCPIQADLLEAQYHDLHTSVQLMSEFETTLQGGSPDSRLLDPIDDPRGGFVSWAVVTNDPCDLENDWSRTFIFEAEWSFDRVKRRRDFEYIGLID